MIPEAILYRGVQRIVWYRATLPQDIRIPYQDHEDVVPAGTEGWARCTVPNWFAFYYDDDGSGVALHINSLTVSDEFVEASYSLQERYYEEIENGGAK